MAIAVAGLAIATSPAVADDHAMDDGVGKAEAGPTEAGQIGASTQSDLINTKGQTIGAITLTQGSGGVLIHVKAAGLAPGKHGLHLHSHGTCDHHVGFTSAKGHVGKQPGKHGLLNPDGPEPGDLPNLYVHQDGTAEMETFTTFVSLTGDLHPLLDADGSSLIIHERADDHKTQPIGGSGPRVACAVFTSDE
ncbi:MAG: hypothetical protein Alpg2KO_07940 [Alphaproteobacteria bacterium]